MALRPARRAELQERRILPEGPPARHLLALGPDDAILTIEKDYYLTNRPSCFAWWHTALIRALAARFYVEQVSVTVSASKGAQAAFRFNWTDAALLKVQIDAMRRLIDELAEKAGPLPEWADDAPSNDELDAMYAGLSGTTADLWRESNDRD